MKVLHIIEALQPVLPLNLFSSFAYFTVSPVFFSLAGSNGMAFWVIRFCCMSDYMLSNKLQALVNAAVWFVPDHLQSSRHALCSAMRVVLTVPFV